MPALSKEFSKDYSDFRYWLMYELPDLPNDKPKVWGHHVGCQSLDHT